MEKSYHATSQENVRNFPMLANDIKIKKTNRIKEIDE